jgi:polar amino acid transport system substrate-binding protein
MDWIRFDMLPLMLRSRFWLMLTALLVATPVIAQTLPYHTDPTAREMVVGTGVPAIRFLTTADFPPFNYRDAGGELIGFNVDLAKRICAEVDVACTIQAWPWEQAADALTDNQGDALIAGLALTAENGATLDFSATYLSLPGRFVVRAPNIGIFDVDYLSGKRVAVREGSAHQRFLERYLPEATVAPYETEIEALVAMRDGEADSFFGDAMRASFWLNENLDCCGFAGEPYFRPHLFGKGMTIAVPAGKDAVRHAIDWALVRLKENGVLDELYLRWFPVGFY